MAGTDAAKRKTVATAAMRRRPPIIRLLTRLPDAIEGSVVATHAASNATVFEGSDRQQFVPFHEQETDAMIS